MLRVRHLVVLWNLNLLLLVKQVNLPKKLINDHSATWILYIILKLRWKVFTTHFILKTPQTHYLIILTISKGSKDFDNVLSVLTGGTRCQLDVSVTSFLFRIGRHSLSSVSLSPPRSTPSPSRDVAWGRGGGVRRARRGCLGIWDWVVMLYFLGRII